MLEKKNQEMVVVNIYVTMLCKDISEVIISLSPCAY